MIFSLLNHKNLVILGIILSNFWIYWVFEHNFFIGELLVIETFLLYLANRTKVNLTLSVLVIIILIILGAVLLPNHFDKNIFSVSEVESISIKQREEYFAQELGHIYKNRVGIFYFGNLRMTFNKISDNFFSSLDLGFYFSPGSIIEQAKFPLFFSPIFIIGLLYLIREIKTIQVIYLITAILISTFTKPDSKIGPLLMFPFINLCIIFGLNRLMKIISTTITK